MQLIGGPGGSRTRNHLIDNQACWPLHYEAKLLSYTNEILTQIPRLSLTIHHEIAE